MKTIDIHERLVYYSEGEELANRFTHAIGALAGLIGAIVLITLASEQHDSYRIVSASIYGVSMVTFYCLSTVYHSVRKPYVRYIFRILDHASIYLMIAGSYTPFALVTLRGPWGWSLFGTVWGLGTVGAVMKIFTTHRLQYIGPILYIALGWIVVIALKPLSAALPAGGLLLLFAGGIAYTVGVIFYLWDRFPYNHAIWHLFVLTGSACHFFSIFYYVIPNRN
ncbi:MAG: hemolysin III family protein [Desulfuromonadaceae bacterium]|nr:hemolysin III family protein [Desulfuromonadaceae bacterium]MDD2849617.1 hemolysin III family protein [Desulfuromonadaceae bacterium]MDD4130924.1 hemolysin III family protein [Desulfuromonadaceae bacterium]